MNMLGYIWMTTGNRTEHIKISLFKNCNFFQKSEMAFDFVKKKKKRIPTYILSNFENLRNSRNFENLKILIKPSQYLLSLFG